MPRYLACDQANTANIFKEIKAKMDVLSLFYRCPLCNGDTDFEAREYQSFKASCKNNACGVLFFIKIDADKNRRFELTTLNDTSNEMGRWQIEFSLFGDTDK